MEKKEKERSFEWLLIRTQILVSQLVQRTKAYIIIIMLFMHGLYSV